MYVHGLTGQKSSLRSPRGQPAPRRSGNGPKLTMRPEVQPSEEFTPRGLLMLPFQQVIRNSAIAGWQHEHDVLPHLSTTPDISAPMDASLKLAKPQTSPPMIGKLIIPTIPEPPSKVFERYERRSPKKLFLVNSKEVSPFLALAQHRAAVHKHGVKKHVHATPTAPPKTVSAGVGSSLRYIQDQQEMLQSHSRTSPREASPPSSPPPGTLGVRPITTTIASVSRNLHLKHERALSPTHDDMFLEYLDSSDDEDVLHRAIRVKRFDAPNKRAPTSMSVSGYAPTTDVPHVTIEAPTPLPFYDAEDTNLSMPARQSQASSPATAMGVTITNNWWLDKKLSKLAGLSAPTPPAPTLGIQARSLLPSVATRSQTSLGVHVHADHSSHTNSTVRKPMSTSRPTTPPPGLLGTSIETRTRSAISHG